MEPADGKSDLEFGDDEDIPLSSKGSRKGGFSVDIETSSPIQREVPNSLIIKKLRRSIYIVLIKAKINVLLPFGPLAILLHYVTHKHVRNTFYIILPNVFLAVAIKYLAFRFFPQLFVDVGMSYPTSINLLGL